MASNNVKGSAETQMQAVLGTLLNSLMDKSPAVVESLKDSIKKLSDKHSNQVLSSCSEFCSKNPKPSPEHISAVLRIMEIVCLNHIVKLNGDTILLTIEISMNIMTENVLNEPVVQVPASGVLVALGREHYVQVMDALLVKLQAGVVPHHMVPHTLGALASANVNGVIPYLKQIFDIILPLLGGLKSDLLKQSFSFALGNFCDALIEYVSNSQQVPDPTITVENFTSELGLAYDIFFNYCLQSREPKVTENILDALSSLFTVLNVEKVTQQTPRAIQALLGLYKKHVDPYYVTKCLRSIIQKASNVNGTLLEPFLLNVLNALFDLVFVSPDFAVQPDRLKCHTEVLRCYDCFALHFTDSTVDQLLVQLKNNNDKERVKSLLIITHLISYSGEQAIKRRFKDIIRYLNDVLNDSSVRVKKVLVNVIVAFSCKKVLFDKEINPDGCEKYLEFILKMCCKQTVSKYNDLDPEELKNVQKASDNTLYMLTTSVPEFEKILWDLLIKCFLGTAYDDAVVIILRCLTHLASKKDKTESCEVAFVRCLAMLANPLPNFRGIYVLNFLKNIKPCNVEAYKTVWEQKIPQLIKYLEQNYENFNMLEWHDLLFDFLNILLETVNNESFIEIIVFKARKQLDIYNNPRTMINSGAELSIKQLEKQFLLKCLATALCFLKDKETILQTLDGVLTNVKLTDYAELHSCAEAIGICSRTHLQIVLDKLAVIRRDVLAKKSSKFNFTFMKDQKHDIGIERLRYTVLYSYSEVCNEAPSDKLLKVIESEILDYAIIELVNAKDFSMKKVCLRVIHSVADAMHPNRNLLHVKMNDRDKVIKLISSQMQLHSGTEYIELFPIVIPTITALIRLPLPIESNDRSNLLKLLFENVYNASAVYCKINPTEGESYYGELKLVPFVTKSFSELNQFVEELLLQNISPAILDEIATMLELWLGKKKAEQRLPAAETLRLVLHTYLENMKFAYDCPTKFGQTGFLLSRVVPRCTDPNKNIRKVAVECLCLILCIAARYEGRMRDHDKVLSNSFQHIQQQIESDEPKLLYNLTIDLAHKICVNMPHFQLIHFVDGLSDALLDCEQSSSYGAGVVLNITLKNKGGELQNQVKNILEKLLAQLYKMQCARTKSSTIRSILSLATHHSRIVCSILLAQPLPYDNYICECWNVLSTDLTLIQDVMDQLKKCIKSTPLYEEQGNDGEIKVASLQPLQAICALHEILKNTQLKETCLQQFPELFSLLLVSLASFMGTVAPAAKKGEKKEKYSYFNRDIYKLNPAKVAVSTLKSFLVCCEFEKMASSLLFISNTDTYEDFALFLEVIQSLVEIIAAEHPQFLSWLVACLGPYIRADLEPQRVSTVAFFTHLLKRNIGDQNVLTENLLEMILDVQTDPSCLVRKLALQGLGYAAENLSYELVSRHCNPILSVLMNSLDYSSIGNESAVILEGMLSFTKLLTAMEGCKFSSFQVTAAVRIKPLLDQEDVNLRRASFHLLGDLTQSLNSEGNLEAFCEQIQGNLITLILHLCDPDDYVVKACKYTLRRIGPYLESPKVNSMIQEHLIDEGNLHFTDFLRDLVKFMAEELQDLFPLLIMTCLSYLKSQWLEIKGNAALLIGLLYSLMVPESKPRVSLDVICDRLMRLLSEENEEVRMKAVEAVSYVFSN